MYSNSSGMSRQTIRLDLRCRPETSSSASVREDLFRGRTAQLVLSADEEDALHRTYRGCQCSMLCRIAPSITGATRSYRARCAQIIVSRAGKSVKW